MVLGIHIPHCTWEWESGGGRGGGGIGEWEDSGDVRP